VLQTRTGEIVSEFAYPQEPIFADPVPQTVSRTAG
jgi:hypothetical protein